MVLWHLQRLKLSSLGLEQKNLLQKIHRSGIDFKRWAKLQVKQTANGGNYGIYESQAIWAINIQLM